MSINIKKNKKNTIQKYKSSNLIKNLYKSFIYKISKIPRLSKCDERKLSIKIKKFNDQKAIKKLALHNIKLAIKKANKYKTSSIDIMDLIQEASIGMLFSAKRWNPNIGTSFGTYSSYWMKAYLIKFSISNIRLINISKTRIGRKLYFRLPKLKKKLSNKGIFLNSKTIARELNEDEKKIDFNIASLENKETSLSILVGANKTPILDIIKSNIQTPENKAIKNQLKLKLYKTIYTFSKTIKIKRELHIWKNHLISEKPISFISIGKKYNVSKQRISQISIKLKIKLKKYIKNQLTNLMHLSKY
jgi:RNA polymerase sigma-32 factor